MSHFLSTKAISSSLVSVMSHLHSPGGSKSRTKKHNLFMKENAKSNSDITVTKNEIINDALYFSSNENLKYNSKCLAPFNSKAIDKKKNKKSKKKNDKQLSRSKANDLHFSNSSLPTTKIFGKIFKIYIFFSIK